MEKHYQFGKTKVTVTSSVTPEERKENLKKIYDVVNEIADKKREEGINVDNWFYTQEEIEKLKQENSPKLIY